MGLSERRHWIFRYAYPVEIVDGCACCKIDDKFTGRAPCFGSQNFDKPEGFSLRGTVNESILQTRSCQRNGYIRGKQLPSRSAPFLKDFAGAVFNTADFLRLHFDDHSNRIS